MGLIFHKTRKNRKSWKSRKQTRCPRHHRKLNKTMHKGGYANIIPTARMIIKYKYNIDDVNDVDDDRSRIRYIQLTSGQMNVDMTEQYKLGHLVNEPLLEIQGLEDGNQYLLTMTEPDALGKTWTHWVAIVNSSRQLIKPAIADYTPPNPPSGSGLHHYIFRLYKLEADETLPRKLVGNERGTYFTSVLEPFVNSKEVVLEASYIVDSGKI